MGTLGDIAKNAETPTGQDLNVFSPEDWGQLIVGTSAFAGAVGLGLYLYKEAKSVTGTQDFDNPLNNVLGGA